MTLRAVYDQERDQQRAFADDANLPFEDGLTVHLGRLSAATAMLLDAPFSVPVRELCRDALASYEEWLTRHTQQIRSVH